jgi:hypothetical protein
MKSAANYLGGGKLTVVTLLGRPNNRHVNRREELR